MPKHTVKAGEHLAKIAYEAGYTNFRHVFDHGENSELKSKRKTPHVLDPDDRVYLPEPELTVDEAAETEKLHTYKVKWDKLKVRIVLHDQSDKPVKKQECTLEVGDLPTKLTSDDTGKIEREIPHDASGGRFIAANDSIGLDIDTPIVVGGLRPVETVPGQIARLNNLGYFAGDPDAPPDPTPTASTPPAGASKPDNAAEKKPDPDAELRFRSAVEEFQCDHGLSVDGKCGPNTQAKLKEVHGC